MTWEAEKEARAELAAIEFSTVAAVVKAELSDLESFAWSDHDGLVSGVTQLVTPALVRARLLIALLCAQERGEIHDAQAWVDALDIKRNPDTCVVEVTRERPLMVRNPGWAVWFARGRERARREQVRRRTKETGNGA